MKKSIAIIAIVFSFAYVITSSNHVGQVEATTSLTESDYRVFLPCILGSGSSPSLCYQEPYINGLLPTGDYIVYQYEFETSGNWIPIPQNCYPQQGVELVSISQEPTSIYMDPTYGNNILYFENLMGQTITATYQFSSTLPVEYNIDHSTISEYDTSSDIYQLYTRSETWIEADNQEIIQAAQSIANGETNPYLIAQALYSWIRANLESKGIPWTGDPEAYRNAYGALATYQRGYGSCQNQALVFVAFCRALGIPARAVHGINSVEVDEERSLENWGHSWAEFFLPEYGWIPVDPIGGRFAEIDNKRLILSYANNLIVSPPCDDSTWYCDPSGDILSLSYPLPYHDLTFLISIVE